jgi:carbon monoxide dehydrogenase subunit G
VIEAHATLLIDRSLEDVFDYLSDARNEPAWLPGAERVEKTSDGPVGLGTTFDGTYARAGRAELTLVTFERPTAVTFRAHAKIVDFDDAVKLSDEGGKTRLSATMTAQPRGLMKLGAPLMAKTMRRQFVQNWTHLKTALEEAPTSRPASP